MRVYKQTHSWLYPLVVSALFSLVIVFSVIGISTASQLSVKSQQAVNGAAIITLVVCNAVFLSHMRTKARHVKDALTRRSSDIQAYCQSMHLSYRQRRALSGHRSHFLKKISGISSRNRCWYNHVTTKRGEYYDYSFEVHDKSGKQATYYFAIMEYKLPRKTPHLIFDSPKALGRKARWIIDDEHKIGFESEFDKHFTSYSPINYDIDIFSFISPEVLAALINADEYDFEFIDNKLIMFGPQDAMPGQLQDMQRLGDAVYLSVEDNLRTYQDKRTSNKHVEVHQAASRLHGSRLHMYMYSGLSLLFAVSCLFLANYFYRSDEPAWDKAEGVFGALSLSFLGFVASWVFFKLARETGKSIKKHRETTLR